MHSSELKPLPTCLPVLGIFSLFLEMSLLDWFYSKYPYLPIFLRLNFSVFPHPSFTLLLFSLLCVLMQGKCCLLCLSFHIHDGLYCSKLVELSLFYLLFR